MWNKHFPIESVTERKCILPFWSRNKLEIWAQGFCVRFCNEEGFCTPSNFVVEISNIPWHFNTQTESGLSKQTRSMAGLWPLCRRKSFTMQIVYHDLVTNCGAIWSNLINKQTETGHLLGFPCRFKAQFTWHPQKIRLFDCIGFLPSQACTEPKSLPCSNENLNWRPDYLTTISIRLPQLCQSMANCSASPLFSLVW